MASVCGAALRVRSRGVVLVVLEVVARWRCALIGGTGGRLLIRQARAVVAFGIGRQREPEGAPAADLRLERQRASQQFGEPARDRETKAGSFRQLRLPELHEFLEDAVLIFGRD